ncbi:hypothetical protein ACIPRI_19930 [Variovorax sp. LARHSF232]
MNRHMKACALAAVATLLLFGAEYSPDAPLGLTLGQDAMAIVGAPLTPVSVAGVARRTTRRVVAVEATTAATAGAQQQQAAAQKQQQTAQQQQAVAQQQAATADQQAAVAKQQQAVAHQQAAAAAPGHTMTALPPGCAPTSKGGVEYQKCGNTYYRAGFQANNLVYVAVQP